MASPWGWRVCAQPVPRDVIVLRHISPGSVSIRSARRQLFANADVSDGSRRDRAGIVPGGHAECLSCETDRAGVGRPDALCVCLLRTSKERDLRQAATILDHSRPGD